MKIGSGALVRKSVTELFTFSHQDSTTSLGTESHCVLVKQLLYLFCEKGSTHKLGLGSVGTRCVLWCIDIQQKF